ncbi:AAA family ATPase [Sphaerisporangium sp. TRM90804]|uniref:AAA family ATPase n=1 Tax=Sphaerisporangium sp. TRM90804 TaxID=3031113 RepID=UPI0024494FD3|nr:AAA family ATPase [Sphaerisporangium sp. TRM90804]MDH2429262.1 AAA family ATPase [Sphaerisporangium sp. TRM90804]
MRYILTGTPGAGKTTILRRLSALGYATVEEAATAVIADEHARGDTEPWTRPSFIDKIVALQRRRQMQSVAAAPLVQFFDRSPICTHVLSTFVGHPIPATLSTEIERITRDEIYDRHVFFIRNLGFCEPTEARRITFEDSLDFERLHEQTYRAFGYHLIDIPAAPLPDRVTAIRTALSQLTTP